MNLLHDLQSIRFWPYFFTYFKINYFLLFLLGGFLLALFSPRLWKSSWNTGICLASIFIFGLILRVLWLIYSPHEPRMTWGEGIIENDLINLNALDILKGIWFVGSDGQPYGRRPLGYPLFLSLIYKFAGPHLWAVWIAHLVLFCLSLFFIYKLSRFLFNREQSLLPVLFYAIYPISIYSVKLITDENLFLPVWLGGLYFYILALKKNKIIGLEFGLAAVLCAYATIIRTHTIFMPAVFAIGFLFFYRNWRKAVCAGAAGILILLMMNAPWAYRNYKLWGVPVMFTATASYVYAQVNSTALPDEGQGHVPAAGEQGYSSELEALTHTGNEGKIHQACNAAMKKWILSHPVQFGVIGIRKLLNFMAWNRKAGVWPLWYQWTPDHFDVNRAPSKKATRFFEEAAFVAYYVVLHSWLIALVLLLFTFRKMSAEPKMLLVTFFCCFVFWFAEHMIIYSDRKYRFPLEALMIILSCQTWFWLRSKKVAFLNGLRFVSNKLQLLRAPH